VFSLKVIIECSKCWGNFPAVLRRVYQWEDVWVYEYETECLNCRVGITCILQEIEEKPEITSKVEVPVKG
jgi:hypothetical protein